MGTICVDCGCIKRTAIGQRCKSCSMRGNKRAVGSIIPMEVREKVSQRFKGKHLSEETRIKISKALMGNTNPVGHVDSDETRMKRSLAQRGELANNWQGDNASWKAGHKRARTLYPEVKPCEGSGPHKGKIHRHHKDRNTLNQAPDNIMWLCNACHPREHARMRREEMSNG